MRVYCRTCNGTGEVDCTYCNGTGNDETRLLPCEEPYMYEPCFYCGRSGKVVCPECHGSAYIEDAED
ncbi:hypothetical protein SAMN02745217_04458 [Anaerocolumna xylanovorans DSM 12503]|uniref:Uncharacterized protein n=1 Tax=Anaerocolumna xylanovorans DSM 12503 TaxID=1121345 RepID=A0A1M7YMY6_9FIRM|nr:hypothetical protein SAMN02745217_04458 [Anaerocolumna xylanovorans DSM 12503]